MGLSASFTLLSFADWEQTGATWKYQNTDKTYLTNSWNWIDGNNDGVSECYYFNADGIMLANTITPDNFTVNENGAWVVNGIVQTQPTQPAPQPTVTEEVDEEAVDPELEAILEQREREMEAVRNANGGSISHGTGPNFHGGDDLKDADTSHLNIGGM